MRAHYEHDLLDLRRQLLWLATTVERAITSAVWALQRRDAGAARRVIAGDAEIDRLRYDLEEQALLLIARQQPFARDLRLISAYINLGAELERIADYAHGTAKLVLRSESLPPLETPSVFVDMADRARDMLRQALRAVVDHDAGAAARLECADDEVDRLYLQAQACLLQTMRESPSLCEAALYLLWSAHNLERIADRTVNIAERAAFIATGQRSQWSVVSSQ